MTRYSFVLFTVLIIVGCNSSTEENSRIEINSSEQLNDEKSSESGEQTDYSLIKKVKTGMTTDEVIEILGETDKIAVLNSNQDAKVEDWFYGDNHKIRFVMDKVNRVVYDLNKEQEIIDEIMKAKKAGDDERTKELIEQLSRGTY